MTRSFSARGRQHRMPDRSIEGIVSTGKGHGPWSLKSTTTTRTRATLRMRTLACWNIQWGFEPFECVKSAATVRTTLNAPRGPNHDGPAIENSSDGPIYQYLSSGNKRERKSAQTSRTFTWGTENTLQSFAARDFSSPGSRPKEEKNKTADVG